MSETTQPPCILQAVRCPCCGNEYDNLDSPADYKRVIEWSAARELGKLNRGKHKTLSDAQREARRVQLAINRSKHQNKTV